MSTQVPIEFYKNRNFITGEKVSTTLMKPAMTEADEVKILQESRKKVRRAFSVPRNPFRWSRKYKTKREACCASDNKCEQHKCEKQESTTIGNGNNSKSNNEVHCEIELNHSQRDSQIDQNSPSTANRVFRRSSFKKFLTRIAKQVTSINVTMNKHASTSSNVSERVPPISGYQWAPDQTPGVMGLKNHGNTCFMNAVLQCLSHTDILAEYFVLDQYKADLKRRNKLNSRKFGTKGELTEQLANVLKALWTCKNESDHSTSFKAVVDRYGSQFRSSTQHDAQEFLFWLLDKVHEDLNTATKRRYKSIKNNYGRPDEVIAAETLANHIRCNNSFVQAVFQAQFRSSLTCPRCKKQSNTFDPFHCISVQLPQLPKQVIFVTVLYLTQHPRQVKLGMTVSPGSPIVSLREQLHADTGIAANRMVLAEINETGFSRVFYDSQPISTLEDANSIYCIEIPEFKEDNSSDIMLLVANVQKSENGDIKRFGTPFCVQVNRDCSYLELQKRILKEMSTILKPEIFSYENSLQEMFQIRLQDPSADPDTYLEVVEHPLFVEVIDMALSVLSPEAGPLHIKLLLEWERPEYYFTDLSDPIVEHESVSQLRNAKSEQAILTLEQCLEHYTKAETLSAEDAWRCPNCQQYLPVVKTLGLWSLPDILVIHFKRFRQQHDKGPDAAKLTTMVKFPLNAFDMSPHLARGSSSNLNENHIRTASSPWKKSKDHKKEIKDNRYDLYAVCYHQGDTLETGHYTAACKNPYDHQWYKFDDQRVTHVPTDQVQDEIVNNEAYILFYQRRKIDNSECSGTSSTSGDHWVSKIVTPAATHHTSSTFTTPKVTPLAEPVTNEKHCEMKVVEGMKTEIKEASLTNKTELLEEAIIIEKTDESELVDVECLDVIDKQLLINSQNKASIEIKPVSQEHSRIKNLESIKILDSRNLSNFNSNAASQHLETAKLNTTPEIYQSVKVTNSKIDKSQSVQGHFNNKSNFKEAFFNNVENEKENARHSFTTSSSYRLRDCDTIPMLRNTVSSCSKDTFIFIDQQNMIEEEDSYLGGRSLWISPVTPHKLITVSPKN